MNQSILIKTGALSATVLLMLCVGVTVARADHSAEEGETSHATTVHDDENSHEQSTVTLTESSTDMEKMQELIKVLQQLIDVLKHQLEHQQEEAAESH